MKRGTALNFSMQYHWSLNLKSRCNRSSHSIGGTVGGHCARLPRKTALRALRREFD